MASFERCRPALGTLVEIEISGDVSRPKLISISNALYERLAQLERSLSRYETTSDVSRINTAAAGTELKVSKDSATVLRCAQRLSRLSDGLFNINARCKSGHWRDFGVVGKRVLIHNRLDLDLGGIAKGYCLDELASMAQNFGVDYTINAGGDLIMSQWKDHQTFVRHPQMRAAPTPLTMLNRASATSANTYQTGEHIIGTKNNLLGQEDWSVTVFANSAMIADALTKIVTLAPNSDRLLDHFDACAVIHASATSIQRHRQLTSSLVSWQELRI